MWICFWWTTARRRSPQPFAQQRLPRGSLAAPSRLKVNWDVRDLANLFSLGCRMFGLSRSALVTPSRLVLPSSWVWSLRSLVVKVWTDLKNEAHLYRLAIFHPWKKECTRTPTDFKCNPGMWTLSSSRPAMAGIRHFWYKLTLSNIYNIYNNKLQKINLLLSEPDKEILNLSLLTRSEFFFQGEITAIFFKELSPVFPALSWVHS